VQAQNQNAQQIAEFLEHADWVDHVFYPGLKSHPDHALAKAQMQGFGGMLSFNLGTQVDSKKFLLSLALIKPTMSLAGIESTALSPHLTSHALLTEAERLAQGITPQMIRFSTGIEAVEDIKADLFQAYKKAIK
jgi:cystathionine beta-lyase